MHLKTLRRMLFVFVVFQVFTFNLFAKDEGGEGRSMDSISRREELPNGIPGEGIEMFPSYPQVDRRVLRRFYGYLQPALRIHPDRLMHQQYLASLAVERIHAWEQASAALNPTEKKVMKGIALHYLGNILGDIFEQVALRSHWLNDGRESASVFWKALKAQGYNYSWFDRRLVMGVTKVDWPGRFCGRRLASLTEHPARAFTTAAKY